ncbi:MAG TPA: ERAP1-like C-terminal domain-containing protein, partial [Candidatus Dormibacteraeota bacterium]|nr:ERAP1-like C-terminal domain-containing protein [Candidatus Dormibacteraeota bacterium]
DLAYTKLNLDPRSIKTLTTHLQRMDDPLARALAWGALWDMVRDAHLRARDYVQIALNNIDVETDAVMTLALINLVISAIEIYGDPDHRAAVREQLAASARSRALGAEPGSDRQLLWTKAFIDAARRPEDVEWVRGLLDGSTHLEGLKVDFAVRWSTLTALARIGAAGADEIGAELSRDPTEEGRRAAATARAARPLPEAKEEAWSAVTNGREVSLAMKRAFAAGFHRADQEPLLEEYVRRYFDDILTVWESHDIDEGLMFVRSMFPSAIVREDVIDLVGEVLSGELPGPVRRALMEAQDGTARELRARRFDSALPGEPVAQE